MARRRKAGGAWSHVAFVESDTRPGVEYEIKARADGALGCSCTAFKFAPGAIGVDKTCKHLRALGVATGAIKRAPMRVDRQHVAVAGETFTFRRAISFGAGLA